MFPPIELISVQTLFVVERQIKKEKKKKKWTMCNFDHCCLVEFFENDILVENNVYISSQNNNFSVEKEKKRKRKR